MAKSVAGQQCLNQYEVMVNALQRSGHHAFIEWVCSNVPGHLFLNCVADARMIRPRYIRSNPQDRFKNDLNIDIEADDYGSATPKNLLLYNTESYTTQQALDIFDDPSKESRVGDSKTRRYVIWIRDPFNNLASQFQYAQKALKSFEPTSDEYQAAINKLKSSREIWCDHWRAYKALPKERSDVIGIIYNDWLDNKDLRKSFLALFDREDSSDVNYTVQWGGGSSFAAYKPGQAAPQKSSLETRYLEHASHPEYRALFEDATFVEHVREFLEHYSSAELNTAAKELLG
ncbi:hypothetical protein [Henriciella litoralis]|uniref:hypothetical protein n=1 Tax=Henriciella litoralis TaxID=568102 RepID=UPI00111C105E|nr:hypothetical protein [Henriciella litoralis]